MKFASILLFLSSALLITLFTNCSNSGDGVAKANSSKYFQQTPNVTIHAYYEAGAPPYTGTVSGGNLWNVLEENLVSIFQYRSAPPTLVIPKTLSAMTSIPTQGRAGWTTTDIRNLHALNGETLSVPSAESHFYIYFVRGYYNGGNGPQTGVIGVSLGGTTIVAIFKDVVEGSSASGPTQRYVEQSTIVHEIGHALGFVNNGVPMTTPHQDTAHGAHTTDTDCVMYWANEGAADLRNFVIRYITSGSKVMWGPQVLADAEALSR